MRKLKELEAFVGRVGRWYAGNGLYFRVRIVDARENWGRIDFQVTPLDGAGERWIADHTVTIEEIAEVEASQDSITATISPSIDLDDINQTKRERNEQ